MLLILKHKVALISVPGISPEFDFWSPPAPPSSFVPLSLL